MSWTSLTPTGSFRGLVLWIALFHPAAVNAVLCAADHKPAATLLVPYFETEINPDDFSAPVTVMTVRNLDAAPTIAQVNIWTDGGVPVFTFPLYLKGYDTVTIDMEELLEAGTLPDTDPATTPTGDLSDPPTSFSGCLPGAFSAAIAPSVLADIQAALTGQPDSNGVCGSNFFGDNVARGYLTIDVRDRCASDLPDEASYYDSPGLAFDNVLVGEYAIIDGLNNFATGDPMVHIEADNQGYFIDGDRSFYRRFSGSAVTDRREPLPTRWRATLTRRSRDSEGQSLSVWREVVPESAACMSFLPVAGFSAPTPITVYDGTGSTTVQSNSPAAPVLAAQRVDLDPFAGSIEIGGIDLRLQDDPDTDGQSWVATSGVSQGRFNYSATAFALDSNCPMLAPVGSAFNGGLSALPASREEGVVLWVDGFESP